MKKDLPPDSELMAAWHSDLPRSQVATNFGVSEESIKRAWARLQTAGLLPTEPRRRQSKVEAPERLDEMYSSHDGRPSCSDDSGFDPLLDKLRSERGTW
jgi:transposase